MINEEREQLIDDICEKLNFPCSGQPERALRELYGFLLAIESANGQGRSWDRNFAVALSGGNDNENTRSFNLAALDALGLLEYGVSVNYPWLCGEGWAVLGMLKRLFAEQNVT